jgi:hypothetical protein
MSKYSEKNKKMLRVFAGAEGSITAEEVATLLGKQSYNDKLGKRKIRHTVGDLVYDGILRSYKPKGHTRTRYWLTPKGRKLVGEFHKPLTMPVLRVFDTAQESNDEPDKIIPKVNVKHAPPNPAINVRRKEVTLTENIYNIPEQVVVDEGPEVVSIAIQEISDLESRIAQGMSSFKNFYASNPDKAIMSLAKQVIRTREELKDLKDKLRSL